MYRFSGLPPPYFTPLDIKPPEIGCQHSLCVFARSRTPYKNATATILSKIVMFQGAKNPQKYTLKTNLYDHNRKITTVESISFL
jgi:hypothetical protein